MRIEVDSGGYTSACSLFYGANHDVVTAVSTLSSGLGSSGGMAGTDTGGAAWAAQYDAAAGPLLQAGADLGESMGQMANLLNAALVNHEGADYGASIGAGPDGGGFGGDSDPDHYTETVLCPDPPSAAGGTGDQPGWWHWIASHVEGLLWPDADTGKLRSAGAAWIKAGQTLTGATYDVSGASAEIGTQTSPEVPDAQATCDDLEQHLTDLAGAYAQIGQACSDYADAVDEHHHEIEDQLSSFIEWTIAIEGAGAVVGFFTFGAGEAAAQAGEAAEVANAGSKAVRVLKDLVEIARAGALKIGDLIKTATSAIERVKGILNAKVIRALEKIAPALTKESKARLIEELAANGIKHDPHAIVTIFRDSGGRIVWLEKGDGSAGLEHVLKHAADFANKGIARDDIPGVLQQALEEGKIVGYQGKGTGRPIYETIVNGTTIKIAITVGANGFIVGANPVS